MMKSEKKVVLLKKKVMRLAMFHFSFVHEEPTPIASPYRTYITLSPSRPPTACR